MKTYLVTGRDKSVIITQVVEGASIEDVIKQFNYPGFDPASWTEIDPKTIPTDREFRDAWVHNGKTFGHDMNKATDIHKDRLRQQRVALLEKLDMDVLNALARGEDDKVAAIEAKKQKLRDFTKDKRFETSKSIDDLRKIKLEEV